jgi:predicted histidine transporter YuiF (NhaC family)
MGVWVVVVVVVIVVLIPIKALVETVIFLALAVAAVIQGVVAERGRQDQLAMVAMPLVAFVTVSWVAR